ncbi:MAG: hypothetical protein IIZ39_08585 [Blautia sp.]|nr:hypothetical protein [Blautia sp.]
MLSLLGALFCSFYVLSPDPLPVVVDDVIIAFIAVVLWAKTFGKNKK